MAWVAHRQLPKPQNRFHTTHSVSNPRGSSPDLSTNQKTPEYLFPVHLTAEPGGILPKETLGALFSGPGVGHREKKTGGTVTNKGSFGADQDKTLLDRD
jgi:hypothetical protein